MAVGMFAAQASLATVYVVGAVRSRKTNELVGSVLAVLMLAMWIAVVIPFAPR